MTSEQLKRKTRKSDIEFRCDKCNKKQIPDKEQGNENWEIFPCVPCECGGNFRLVVIGQAPNKKR